MFFSKKILLLPKSKENINPKPNPSVEILGNLPVDFAATAYHLMKRGEYFYAVVSNSPEDGQDSTAVRRKNYIVKTKDFVNWTGSKIGSGYTTYDDQSDSFYSATLAMHYDGKANGVALVAYHVTKINPDDFSYTNTTIMSDTSMSKTSRGIARIQRVGDYLMFLYYKGQTNVFMCYSTNNGSTWTSKQIYSTPNYSYGGSGIRHVSNGSRSIISAIFGSTSQTVRYFTSPTASAVSNCKMCFSDKSINTIASNIFYLDTINNVFYKTDDLVNYSTSFPYKHNSLIGNAIFHQNYLISTCDTTSLRYNSSLDYSHIGKISIYDLTTKKFYTFDTGLDVFYLYKAGTNTYPRGLIRIISFIEEQVYFIFQTEKVSNYRLAKVPISYILENMQETPI